MENTQPNEPRRGQAAGTWWLVQAISGLLLILVLGLHMIAQHFLVEGGLREFADVIAYVSNPLIFAIEIVFLVVVTTHAMLGVRAICLDLGLSERGERAVNWVAALVGIAAVGYGIWLAISIQSLA
jgi:succinate dehydrogenase / fumarate reductase membrane anchor subunit